MKPRLPTFTLPPKAPLRVRVISWTGRKVISALTGLFLGYDILQRRQK